MFVGHALLAFALAALAADWRGWDRRRALLVGAVAGAFAAIPDVDVLYALVGLLEWILADATVGAPAAFWDAGNVVHRSVTHSLVVGAVAAPAFGLLAVRGGSGRSRLAAGVATGLFGALVATAFLWDGPLAAFTMGLFLGSGVVVASVVASTTTLSPRTVTLAALWGLWSHPWGDLFTGSPPDLLFPVAGPVLESRVVLHADPTLHLLAAFAIELATVWLAVGTYCHLAGWRLRLRIHRRAGAGALYGVVALLAVPPTLEVSYHFVFSILAVGLVCSAVRIVPTSIRTHPLPDGGTPSTDAIVETALTAIATVSIAWLSYVVVYLFAVAG